MNESMPPPPAGYAACRVRPTGMTQITHLVSLDQYGNNGGRPTLCGLTRFPTSTPAGTRQPDLPGWTMNGGVSGPGVTQSRCIGCWAVLLDLPDNPDDTEPETPVESPIPEFPYKLITFERQDEAHVSRSAAAKYVRARGWSLGPSSVSGPSIIHNEPNTTLPKWPNRHRYYLYHGVLVSGGPHGPNTIWLAAPDEAPVDPLTEARDLARTAVLAYHPEYCDPGERCAGCVALDTIKSWDDV